MGTVIASIATWIAKQFVPTTWLKETLTSVITRLLNRFFEMADGLAKKTDLTDVDDKAVTALRSWIMAEGVIAHFVEVVISMIFGTTPPAPVDPMNPPAPEPTPSEPRKGILSRLGSWLGRRVKNNL